MIGMDAKVSANVRIRQSHLRRGEMDLIRSELTLVQKGGEEWGFGPGQVVPLFTEYGDFVEIPRAYGAALLGDRPWIDETMHGSPIEAHFTKTLRPEQGPLIDDFMSQMGHRKREDARFGGIFSAACGTGKTVMAIRMICDIGRTAIILVHTSFLMKQWVDQILAFTDLSPEDVGRIQQDRCEWQGRKICVAMIESLVAREYERDMYKHFGVAVLDEVHRHGAASWHKAIMRFPARLRIGLSATPRRGDGLWNIIRWNVGEVLTRATGGEKAKVFQIFTGLDVPHDVYERGDHEINLAKLLSVVCGSARRNDLIANELVRAVKKGRRVLVLSDRLAHLDALQALFEAKWEADPTLGPLVGVPTKAEAESISVLMGCDSHAVSTGVTFAGPQEEAEVRIGRYVGGISDKQIEYARTCNLLFGTLAYAKEGLDDPGMDTLFLVSPKGDVEQPVGRILRRLEGKGTPIVVDFVDEKIGPCIGFKRKRLKQYAALGFEVGEIGPRR